MKKILSIAAVITFLIAAVYKTNAQNKPAIPEVGTMAINIAMPNQDGKILKLSALKGKLVLLEFWAS